MTDEEHEKWNEWYAEAVRRDLERAIYKKCDADDAEAASGDGQ